MTAPTNSELGRIVAVHPIAPAQMQRAVFIAVLAFLFFLATMFAFYIRQNLLYFLLASAFLVLYLAMMFAVIMRRKTVVEVRENGFRLKDRTALWPRIASVADDGKITLDDGSHIDIPAAILDRDRLLDFIRNRITA